MAILTIECPDEVLELPGQTRDSLEAMAREALLVRLFERGLVSSGWAAEALGIARREFLDRLAEHGVAAFDEEADPGAEARLGR